MKLISVFIFVFLSFNISYACQELMSEKAQDRDASVKFSGKAISYKIMEPKKLAMVTFSVFSTARGEHRESWDVYFRSTSLPKNLRLFQKKFGEFLEVGIRKMIAPGEKSDSKKKVYYIVDNACSTNGEDWLINSSPRPLCGGKKTVWYQCQKNSDCTISQNVCGHKEAFNSRHSTEISVYNKCIRPHIDCVSPKYDRNKDKIKSLCKNNKCTISIGSST